MKTLFSDKVGIYSWAYMDDLDSPYKVYMFKWVK